MAESKGKVLIVDDEQSIRDSISALLKKKGFDVEVAANGEECFQKIEDSLPHLVLLDYKLSGENGLDILRKISDKWVEIAVIMLTGAGAEDVRLAAESIKNGAYEYIPKPPDFTVLPILIEKTIALHRERLERNMAEERHKIELEKGNKRLEDIAVDLNREKQRLEDSMKELLERNKELEKAQKAKTEFLANVSHELRTPLNVIIGFSTLLLDEVKEPLTEKQTRYVENVLGSGRRLLRLIDDILDLSKLELLKVDVNYDEFSLPQIIDDALLMVKENAEKKNISIRADIDKELNSILTDERKFKQIIFQLLDNAVKFTPEKGKAAIDASIMKREDLLKDKALAGSVSPIHDGDFLKFVVSDTGIGITEDDQKRLFISFEKIDSGYTREYEGTGLGLVLVKRLLELLGGNIWVESEFGHGSRFNFVIPYYKEFNLDFCLEKGINDARRNQLPFSLIMAMIENTNDLKKALNEEGYKKAVGDIERLFKNDLRGRKDAVCIYKEKIVGITAGADKKGAEAIMLRIKRSLQKHKFTPLHPESPNLQTGAEWSIQGGVTGFTEKGVKIKVKIKIGTASYPDEAITKEELLNTAEERALGEKENGA
ncbi:MAG: response regulator [Nitrospirae bacterium]|nr:response regulator [Nitrospirota bacterium]